MSQPRKYPRLACNHVGELELRRRRPDGKVERMTLPVRIRSLSLGGVGLEIEGRWNVLLHRNDTVISRFALGGRLMELPGRLAWFAGTRIGVELHIALMTSDRRADLARVTAIGSP
jgi:hypothetical protein